MRVLPPPPCVRCGCCPVPATVNEIVYSWTPAGARHYRMENMPCPPGQPEYIPLTDLCLSCLFMHEQVLAWHILDLAGAMRHRHAVWMMDCMPGYAFGEAWRDFSTLTFGRQIGLVAAPAESYPFNTTHVPWAAHYRPTQGLIFVTQSWVRRVRYRDTPLYVEERWNPTLLEQQTVLHGLKEDIPDSVVHKALRGRRLLQVLSQSGRPRGGRFRDADECKAAVLQAIEDVFQQGARPSQIDIEYLLFGIESGGRQLRRALAPYQWSDLLREVRLRYPDVW